MREFESGDSIRGRRPAPPGAAFPARPPGASGAGADAAGDLDLGSRIGLAADLQSTAGNAAMAHLVGLVRTDHKTDPPGGLGEIMALSGPATAA